MISISNLFEDFDTEKARKEFWKKQIEQSKGKVVPGSVGEKNQKKITKATEAEAKGKYPK